MGYCIVLYGKGKQEIIKVVQYGSIFRTHAVQFAEKISSITDGCWYYDVFDQKEWISKCILEQLGIKRL